MLVVACGRAGDEAAVSADKQRVAQYLQTFLIDRNWSEWSRYFSPGATFNGSDLSQQIMRGTADGLNYSFADLELHVVDQVAEPNHIATFFVLSGRHERPFNDQPATHERVQLDGFVIDNFRDHKIVASRMVLDVWGLSRRTAAAARR